MSDTSVPKLQVYTVLQSSLEPLTFSGLVALLHKQVGAKFPLHVFSEMESANIHAALDELTSEGKVKARSVENIVWEVVHETHDVPE